MNRLGLAAGLGLLLAGAVAGTVLFAGGTPGSLPGVNVRGKTGQVLVMKSANQAAGDPNLTWNGVHLIVEIPDAGAIAILDPGGIPGIGGGLTVYDGTATGHLQFGGNVGDKFSVDFPFCFQDGQCQMTAAHPSDAQSCPFKVLNGSGNPTMTDNCGPVSGLTVNPNGNPNASTWNISDFSASSGGLQETVSGRIKIKPFCFDDGGCNPGFAQLDIPIDAGTTAIRMTEGAALQFDHLDYASGTTHEYCVGSGGNLITCGDTMSVTGAFTYNGGKTPAATTDLRSYAIFTGTPTTAVLGSALVQGVFSAPSAGVPARFAFRVNTAGLGAGSVTLSLFDSTTSASKGSATFGCTATGDQSLAVTSPTAWAVNDAVEIRIDDSACTAANGPIGIPSASVQWQ